MKALRFFLFLFAAISTFSLASAQQWPVTSPEKLDTMNLHMAAIKGMPDSVVVKNPLIFVDKVDEDEYDIYVVNKYLTEILVFSRMYSSNPATRGRSQAYASLLLLNEKGDVVRQFRTNQGAMARFDVSELEIPDGIYRLRVDYGGKYAKNGTKPKNRTTIQVQPSTTLSSTRTRFAPGPASGLRP